MIFLVINLKEDISRLQKACSALSKHHIKWERIEAIKGNSIQRESRPDIFCGNEFLVQHNFLSKTIYRGKLTDGELGCALSHLKAYHKIAISNEDGGIIMEDDFIVNTHIPDVISKALKLKPNADIIACQGKVNNGLRLAIWSKSSPIPETNNRITRAGIPGFDWLLNRRRRNGGGTVCYWISKKACFKLLEIGYPVKFEADVLTGMVALNHLKYYVITPSLGHRLDEINPSEISTIGLHGGCKFE